MAIIAALRRRDVLALILTLSLFIFTFSIFSQPTQIISTTLAWPRVESLASPAQLFESVYIDETDLETPFESEPGPESEFESELEPLEVLAQIYEDERIALLADYDQATTESLVRSPAGALDPHFGTYISRLEGFVNTWFEGSEFHPDLTAMLARLVTAHPPTLVREFEKTLYSLEKNGREAVPPEFEYWEKRLGEQALGISKLGMILRWRPGSGRSRIRDGARVEVARKSGGRCGMVWDDRCSSRISSG